MKQACPIPLVLSWAMQDTSNKRYNCLKKNGAAIFVDVAVLNLGKPTESIERLKVRIQ